jgi:hypothetical protein
MISSITYPIRNIYHILKYNVSIHDAIWFPEAACSYMIKVFNCKLKNEEFLDVELKDMYSSYRYIFSEMIPSEHDSWDFIHIPFRIENKGYNIFKSFGITSDKVFPNINKEVDKFYKHHGEIERLVYKSISQCLFDLFDKTRMEELFTEKEIKEISEWFINHIKCAKRCKYSHPYTDKIRTMEAWNKIIDSMVDYFEQLKSDKVKSTKGLQNFSEYFYSLDV